MRFGEVSGNFFRLCREYMVYLVKVIFFLILEFIFLIDFIKDILIRGIF